MIVKKQMITGKENYFISLIVFAISLLFSTSSFAIINGSFDDAGNKNSVIVMANDGTFCSGVPISKTAILTAAFCVNKKAKIAITTKDNNKVTTPIAAAQVIIHPLFNENAMKERKRTVPLAIIKTEKPLPSNINTMKLEDFNEVDPSENLKIGGFGQLEENNNKTAGQFRSVTLKQKYPYGPSSILFWLVPQEGEAGACLGDAGGPVTFNDKLVGIILWAEGNIAIGKKCGTLTQALKLKSYLSWIKQVAENQ